MKTHEKGCVTTVQRPAFCWTAPPCTCTLQVAAHVGHKASTLQATPHTSSTAAAAVCWRSMPVSPVLLATTTTIGVLSGLRLSKPNSFMLMTSAGMPCAAHSAWIERAISCPVPVWLAYSTVTLACTPSRFDIELLVLSLPLPALMEVLCRCCRSFARIAAEPVSAAGAASPDVLARGSAAAACWVCCAGKSTCAGLAAACTGAALMGAAEAEVAVTSTFSSLRSTAAALSICLLPSPATGGRAELVLAGCTADALLL